MQEEVDREALIDALLSPCKDVFPGSPNGISAILKLIGTRVEREEKETQEKFARQDASAFSASSACVLLRHALTPADSCRFVSRAVAARPQFRHV